MTPLEFAALIGAVALLAAVPSVSVLAVTARASTAGFRHGAALAAGVCLGDAVFILLALFGLSLVAELLGRHAFLMRYAAALYVIWLGLSLWRKHGRKTFVDGSPRESLLASTGSGLLLTLGDQKAVLFYFGFFPAFIDLQAASARDVLGITAATVLTVLIVKLGYAWAGAEIGVRFGDGFSVGLNRTAGTLMIIAGLMLVFGGRL